jgi:hypothetical protein
MSLLKVLGLAALASIAYGVVVNFNDIKRYVRISTM